MSEYTVDTVGVVSLAKILGIIGTLWGIVVATSWVVLGDPSGGGALFREPLLMIAGGAAYGVVGGAMTALVYNLAASLVGGIELKIS